MLTLALFTFVVIWFSLWCQFMDNRQGYLLKNIDKIAIYLIILLATFSIFTLINWFDFEFKPQKDTIDAEEKIRSAYGALGDFLVGF